MARPPSVSDRRPMRARPVALPKKLPRTLERSAPTSRMEWPGSSMLEVKVNVGGWPSASPMP
eukprot:4816852-Alexandrium_andersonii.AAC.1